MSARKLAINAARAYIRAHKCGSVIVGYNQGEGRVFRDYEDEGGISELTKRSLVTFKSVTPIQ